MEAVVDAKRLTFLFGGAVLTTIYPGLYGQVLFVMSPK